MAESLSFFSTDELKSGYERGFNADWGLFIELMNGFWWTREPWEDGHWAWFDDENCFSLEEESFWSFYEELVWRGS